MARQQISEDLKKFIKEHLHSVYTLETLLLLHRNEGKEFTALDVATELGFEEEVAREQFNNLSSLGLLSNSGNFRCMYNPTDNGLRMLVDRLALAYFKQRVPILSLILADRSDRIRLFAEAFRVIRGSD